ncbi:hypothetical protein QNI19_08025 [Cytophagaceae bacterium DM2B3-1]|uniref:Sugar-binding protein n=1 Tax=Xanthocytophaga flava TaxID=3048013 RepID=A0ABT7CGK3_9BACT|nr:hypothetical protein [Xanthocytophaga flavus]MDJ1492874.1 hypothetical protein [Xanthocytophaga flavus]
MSTYTGIPDITIPIYQIKSGDISVPITLSYHASGIKVAEEASRVGIGWVLNSGGLISKTIMGMDDYDDSPYAYFNTPELPAETSPSNYLISQPTIQTSCASDGRSVQFPGDQWFNSPSDPYDFEPDQYSFNFMGYSGKFILDRSKKVILSNLQKIKIIPPATSTDNWQVKTSDGFLYTFSEFEFYRDTQNNKQHKTAWYLTSIRSAKGEVVTFNYTKLPTDYIRPIGAYHERRYEANLSMPVPLSGISTGNVPDMEGSVEAGKEYSNIYLSSIDFKGGKLNFLYDSRQDLAGDKRLTSIEVLVKQSSGNLVPLKQVVLGHDYFEGSNDVDYYPSEGMSSYVTKRLKLVSVTEKAYQGSQLKSLTPYVFDYYEVTASPAKTSFARDHWGYYNGKTGNTKLAPEYKNLIGIITTTTLDERVRATVGVMKDNRDSDSTYIKAFSLKSVQYPTGGKTVFEYEPHDFDLTLSRKRDQSYFKNTPLNNKIAEIYCSYPGTKKGEEFRQPLDLSDEYVDEKGNYQLVEVITTFRFGGACSSFNTVHAYVSIEGVSGTGTWYLNSATCTNPASSYAVFEHRYTLRIPPGIYTWKAFVASPDNDSKADSLQDIRSTFRYVINTEDPYSGGVIRIKRVTSYDGVKREGKVKRYIYNYSADKNEDGKFENYSYGILMAVPQYTYFEHREGRMQNPATQQESPYDQVLLIRSSDSNITLNGSANGSVVGYSQVSELEGENGENGKTIYQYENQPDRILNYDVRMNLTPGTNGSNTTLVNVPSRPPSISTQPYLKNGLLLNKTEYVNRNGIFTKQHEVINTYVEKVVNAESTMSSFYHGIENRWPISSGPIGQGPCISLLYLYPALETKWIYRTSSTEKIYDQFDTTKFSSITTNYGYESVPKHYQLLSTTQYKQNQIGRVESLITRYKYPADYSDAECNMVVQAMKSDQYYMHSSVIEQTQWKEKDGIQKILGRNFTKNNFVATSNAAVNIILPQEVVALEIDRPLDESLNPVSTDQVAPYIPSQTYDPLKYKEKLEFIYTPEGNIRSLRQKEDNVWITYLWGYNNQYPIAEIKNATYNEVLSALGQTTIEQLASSLSFDASQLTNLKQALPNAQISLYTYKPLIGIYKVTSPDGTTLTYEYDEFQRLKYIKDAYGNVVKQYQYHYKGQPN